MSIADLCATLVDSAAEQVHPNPTPKQTEAQNYRSGHVRMHGLDMTIETAKGQVRKKYNPDGSLKFERLMHAHYGRIRGTKGADLEHIDVFIGPCPESQLIFVINQMKPDGSFDEHKVVAGCTNATEAKELYLKHYPKDWTGFGGMRPMLAKNFKDWVLDGPKMRRVKKADLKSDIHLQPHQERIFEEAEEHPIRKLLVHALGSGKSLSAIGAAEAQGQPYTALVPASLRPNFNKEIERFTTGSTPSDVVSYTQAAKGYPINKLHTLIADEAQRLRNPGSKQTQRALDLAEHAKQLVLLSGTPVVNRPGDLAAPIQMLTGKHMDPDSFEKRYVGAQKVNPGIFRRLMGVTPGYQETIAHPAELKSLLKGHVDYYAPSKDVVPVTHEDHTVEMSVPQARLYKAMWDELPWVIRWKIKNDFPMTRDELRRTRSFLVGPRQVGLSTYPYQREKDPIKAFEQSSKLQEAYRLNQETLKDPRTKSIVFSNFIDAGLVPYSAALQRAGVPHGLFHGGLSDIERKKLVEDFNSNKLRVALLGPSGAEGISLKGIQLLQTLDPYWNVARTRQAEGRGLRFDSHTGLPDDLQNVKIQRFISRLPLGFKDRLLSRLGLDRTPQRQAADDYLRAMSARKDQLNHQFMDLLQEVGTQKAGMEDESGPMVGSSELISQLANLVVDSGDVTGSLVLPVPSSDEVLKEAMSETITALRAAKNFSDVGDYGGKHKILKHLIHSKPHEWFVDNPSGPYVGLTHRKSGWRFHLPRAVVPGELLNGAKRG